MDGQRQRSGNGRKRRRRSRGETRVQAEPVLIAARRPNSPLINNKVNGQSKSLVAASASPARTENGANGNGQRQLAARPATPAPKRSARIVQLPASVGDERERQRERLLERLMCSEGRGAISRAATEYQQAGFEFPEEQEVQLQLLEHFDETQARDAVETLERLLTTQPPIKKPILEQRLRRLEEYADELATREAAAQLRRNLRS